MAITLPLPPKGVAGKEPTLSQLKAEGGWRRPRPPEGSQGGLCLKRASGKEKFELFTKRGP